MQNHSDKEHKKGMKDKQSSRHEYICPICAKIFKSKSNLSQHEKTHKVLKPDEYFYCVGYF